MHGIKFSIFFVRYSYKVIEGGGTMWNLIYFDVRDRVFHFQLLFVIHMLQVHSLRGPVHSSAWRCSLGGTTATTLISEKYWNISGTWNLFSISRLASAVSSTMQHPHPGHDKDGDFAEVLRAVCLKGDIWLILINCVIKLVGVQGVQILNTQYFWSYSGFIHVDHSNFRSSVLWGHERGHDFPYG